MVTRNTLDCDQSNVYSSRVVFSTISQDLRFRSFSLYRRSASDLPCEISFESSSTIDNRIVIDFIKEIRFYSLL